MYQIWGFHKNMESKDKLGDEGTCYFEVGRNMGRKSVCDLGIQRGDMQFTWRQESNCFLVNKYWLGNP